MGSKVKMDTATRQKCNKIIASAAAGAAAIGHRAETRAGASTRRGRAGANTKRPCRREVKYRPGSRAARFRKRACPPFRAARSPSPAFGRSGRPRRGKAKILLPGRARQRGLSPEKSADRAHCPRRKSPPAANSKTARRTTP